MAFHEETRRCAACGEPALRCEYAVDHLRGRQSVGMVGHWRCLSCGAIVGLASAAYLAAIGGTGLLVFGVLGAVVLWAAFASATGQVEWTGAICGGLLLLLAVPTVAITARMALRLHRHPVVDGSR